MSSSEANFCDPRDIAIKSFFLGPQGENGAWIKGLLNTVLDQWLTWRASVFPMDGRAVSPDDQEIPEFLDRCRGFERDLGELVQRFESEIPKFSPRYIGHMFSEVSLPALLGHIVTLLHNPNNISEEASRVGVAIEAEAITSLCRMVGYPESARGHFTSGGTVANIEGMLRARLRLSRWLALGAFQRSIGRRSDSLFACSHRGWRQWDELHEQLNPADSELNDWDLSVANPWKAAPRIAKLFGVDALAPVILVPGHAHYSWKKAAGLLGLGEEAIWQVKLDSTGALSLKDLRHKIGKASRQSRPILMIVSVLGSTELGKFDPIHEVCRLLESLRLQEGVDIWHHIDAAFGGFLCTLDACDEIDPAAFQALRATEGADSITLDPHKLGYVPYSSGSFLCSNSRNYELPRIHAPYIRYTPSDRGQVTIEGSRSAAGAVATYLTARSIGLNAEGYGRILRRTIQMRKQMASSLTDAIPEIRIAPHGESNILCFHVAREGEQLTTSNERTLALYDAIMTQEGRDRFFISRTDLTLSSYEEYLRDFTSSWRGGLDADHMTVIRLCLMNPFIGSREMKVDFISEFARMIQSRITPAKA